MKKISIRSLAFLVTIAQLSVQPSLLAQENTTDPIIVTATRMESDVSQLPANITIITATDIQFSPVKTLPELLNLEAGVNSRSLYGNNAARSTIDMRGFGAAAKQNTLILLDGRRLNDIDLSAVDFAAIPLGNIERIEIIRGGSVLYGDGAAGGTINIITKQGDRVDIYNDASLTVGSYNSRQLEGIFRHTDGLFSINVSANVMESNGYRDHNEIQQQNLQADLRFSQTKGELFLKFGLDNQNLDLPSNRTVDPTITLDELSTARKGTGTPNDYADQDGHFITAGLSRFITDNIELIVDAGYRRKNQQSFFDDYVGFLPAFPIGTFASFVDTELRTWSITPRIKADFGAKIPHTVTAGIDIYDSDYLSYRAQRPGVASKHRYDANQESLAIYLHGLVKLTNVTHVTAGTRFQRIKVEASDTYDATAPGQPFGGSQAASLKTSNNEHMLELGIKHEVNQTVSLFGKLERSVRIGTLDEILDTFASTFSPLTPQTATHLDLGIAINQGRHRLKISTYLMHLRNEIHFDSATFSNVNLDPTRRFGLELTDSFSINDDLRVKANYAYTRSEFREGSYAGNEVPLVANNTAGLSVLWEKSSHMNFSASANYIGEKYFDNDQQNSFTKIPAYTTVDLKLRNTRGEWRVEGAIHNLLDKKAFDFGVKSTATIGRYNAYPLPERNFTLSVSREF